ncbi:MAG: hypothetical protein ACPGXL_10520 [Chitinophagales bacterium]
MDKLIKVDRIATVVEAMQLEALGVDIIGVSMNKTRAYTDNRFLDRIAVCEIANSLAKAKLAVEIDPIYTDLSALIEQVKLAYIQVPNPEIVPLETAKILQTEGIEIIYSGISAADDDDSSWILSRYIEEGGVNVAFYQVDVLATIKNSWNFFKSECPKYPDVLQIEDVAKLSEEYPMIISLDFTEGNVLEVLNRFPSSKGISLRLSDEKNRSDLHCFNYQAVLDILRFLKKGET